MSETTVGIICLTNDNKDKPWILYEAGALTKGLPTSRVMPFLIDLSPTDLRPPISQLNAINPDEASVRGLVKTINLQLNDSKLPPEVFNTVFATFWPTFTAKFADILKSTPETETVVEREEKDILSEILLNVRSFDRRIRELEGINNFVTIEQPKNDFERKKLIQDHTLNLIKHLIYSNYAKYGDMLTEDGVMRQLDGQYLGNFSTSEVYSWARNAIQEFETSR